MICGMIKNMILFILGLRYSKGKFFPSIFGIISLDKLILMNLTDEENTYIQNYN